MVREHILAALRYWVIEMHVDGFRFDLASVLGRDGSGDMLANAPVLEQIAEDPILRETKHIAEAWDAAGAYQVGSFSQRGWAEWNGRYRDDIRRFWRGDDGMLGSFASRICGSADIYAQSDKCPNEANGESNRDGTNQNFSENYGAEGETQDAGIKSIRMRQIKNFLLTLLVSRGVPMLLGGDEFRRTQGGNNNAYCQDNETSWYDWNCLEQHQEIYRFVRGMIAFRQAHPVLSKEEFYTEAEIRWFSERGSLPNWADLQEKRLACLIQEDEHPRLYLMFNTRADAVDFNLPLVPQGARWHRAADTSRNTPQDGFADGEEHHLDNSTTYRLEAHSSAILVVRTSQEIQRHENT